MAAVVDRTITAMSHELVPSATSGRGVEEGLVSLDEADEAADETDDAADEAEDLAMLSVKGQSKSCNNRLAQDID